VAVVGFPRSGTSFLHHALTNAPGFGGSDSEQFFDIYSYLLRKLPEHTTNEVLDAVFARLSDLLPAEVRGEMMAQERSITIVDAAVGMWKDIRALGEDYIDALALARLLPTDDFYAVKRPCMDFFLPMHLEYYCQKSKIFSEVRYLVTVRHPLETWASGCIKFAWWNKSQAFGDGLIRSWLTFMEDALRHGATFIDYRGLEAAPQESLDRVAQAIGAPRIQSPQFRQSSLRAVDVRASREQLAAIDAMLARIAYVN
jgi:hypothetical protein